MSIAISSNQASANDVYPVEPETGLSGASVAVNEVMVFPAVARVSFSKNRWAPTFAARLKELVRLEANWDTYDAPPIDQQAILGMVEFLVLYDSYIMSPPVISPTTDGGLTCEWRSEGFEMQIESHPRRGVSFYFCDRLLGEEWEGDIGEADYLHKWLWQASSIKM